MKTSIEHYDFLSDDEALSFVALISAELLNIAQARQLKALTPRLQEVHRISVLMKESSKRIGSERRSFAVAEPK
jgi:hypothetical protein